MKDYFTSREQMEIMLMITLQSTLKEVLEDWDKRKCLTKDERRNLKMSSTYMTKFINSLFSRMNKEEIETLNKKMSKNTVRLYDKYELDRLNKKINDAYAVTKLTEDEFCTIAEQIMDINCKNCNKNRHECMLYKVFDENNAPEMTGETFDNCKYHYE